MAYNPYRNLFRDTMAMSDTAVWVQDAAYRAYSPDGGIGGYTVMKTGTEHTGLKQDASAYMVTGHKYTLSCLAKADGGEDLALRFVVGGVTSAVTVTKNWTQVSATFTYLGGAFDGRFELDSEGTLWICCLQLEEGESASKWTRFTGSWTGGELPVPFAVNWIPQEDITLAPYVYVTEPGESVLAGFIDDYTSLTVTQRTEKLGEFTCVLPYSEKLKDVLRLGRIAEIDDYQYLIECISIEQDTDGVDTVTFSGRELRALLGCRISVPPAIASSVTYTGTCADIVKDIVSDECIAPMSAARAITDITFDDMTASGGTVTVTAKYDTVDDVITDACAQAGFRCKLQYDIGTYTIGLRPGEDHTAGGNAPVIFSDEYDNLQTATYEHDKKNSANTVYALGEGKDTEREISWFGDGSTGFDRKERMLTVSKYASGGFEDAARQALANKYSETKTFEGEALTASGYRFGVHYNVGDLVTIRSARWGVEADVRITEAERIWEADDCKLTLTFGKSAPSIVDMVKREIASLKEMGQ